jgi:phosphoglycerate dehydrogenase-like enzyme
MGKPKLVTFMPLPLDIQISQIFSGRIDPSKVDIVTVPPNSSEKEVHQAVAGATVILTPPIRTFNRKLLEHAKGVKLFQFAGAGYDNIVHLKTS